MNIRPDRWQRLEARVAAIEFLTAKLTAETFMQRPNSLEALRRANDKIRGMLDDQTLPGHTQSWKDTLSIEFQCAMERILLLMEDIIDRVSSRHTPQASQYVPPSRCS